MGHQIAVRPPGVSKRIEHTLRRRILCRHYVDDVLLPTEHEVAAEFGVSRGSVSAALEAISQDGLIEQTPGRGTRVVEERRGRKPSTIAFVSRLNRTTAPDEPKILQDFQQALQGSGVRYDWLWASDEWQPDIPTERWVDRSRLHELGKRYAGVLLFEDIGVPDEVLRLHRSGMPVAVAGLFNELDVSGTLIDHRAVFQQAVHLLAAMGHRRIALLRRSTTLYHYARVQQGYCDGLKDVGIEPDPDLIAQLPSPKSLDSYLATRRLLEMPDRPTAIIAGRDYIAEGAWRAMEEAELVIGRDVSLLGYDDASWDEGQPQLTTFHEPFDQLASTALDILIDMIVNGEKEPKKKVLPATLVMRRSVGPGPHPPLNSGMQLVIQQAEGQP